MRLVPPSAASCKANRETISPGSVWNTCLSVVYAGAPITLSECVARRSLIWVRTIPLESWRPRSPPTCAEIPTYAIMASRREYRSTGIPLRTKNPLPWWSSLAWLCSFEDRIGRGNVAFVRKPSDFDVARFDQSYQI